MAGVDVDRVGPVQVWAGPLQEWLDASTVSQERSLRTVLAFGRYSDWVSGRGLGAQDVDEDLIDEYIGLERKRSGSRVPAAAQYLPLVKRFLSEQGVFVRRPPVSRRREGRPRLRGGPLDEVVLDLVAWLKVEGYANGTAISVACTGARLSVWMARRGLSVKELDDAVLDRFAVSQARGRPRHPSSARRIVTIRRFLLEAGWLLPPPVAPVVLTPGQQVLQEWSVHLRSRRGVGLGWVSESCHWVQDFVAELPIGPWPRAGVPGREVHRAR